MTASKVPSGGSGRWVTDLTQSARASTLGERLRGGLGERLRASPRGRAWIARQFHHVYYEQARTTWRDTRWRHADVAKSPMDLWLYQELIHELRPDVLVETGTFKGGSALFYADLMDVAGTGRVVSVDLDSGTAYPEHERITYLTGSSVAPDVVARVEAELEGAGTVLVVLDSDHRAAHVREELAAYAAMVTPGSMLVVEDTNVNGHPVWPTFGPGPHEAVEEFLAGHPEFTRDPGCEKFLFSFNQGGWLRRAA